MSETDILILTCSETDIILILTMGTTFIREIVKEKVREKYGSLYRYAKLKGKSLIYITKILKGETVSRPMIYEIAKDLDMPELCFLYEQLLHEKKNANKKKVSQSKKASSLDKKKGVEKDGQKA